jgi:hypothetical protein
MVYEEFFVFIMILYIQYGECLHLQVANPHEYK